VSYDDILNREKWVRIMCDFSADGVWDKEGRACSADELPIPTHVKTMIGGWQAWYEHSDHSDMTPWFDASAHAAFGLFIARLVKRSLPDWTVIYFDEAEYRPGKARTAFEYEILLNPNGTFSR